MMPRHGLVIGKFYPPHAGHHLLVRAAARGAARVTVVVMAASVESIPLELRVEWMREVHRSEPNVTVVGAQDDYRVDYNDPDIWQAHVSIMKEAVASITTEPVDAVFSSEAYGEELARRFEARHIPVDPTRGWAPVSGTAVRRDPISYWSDLAPPVRAWFARHVAIVGAESTGKTTLAAELTEQLCARGGPFVLTRWVPEFGREYALSKLVDLSVRRSWLGEPVPRPEELEWCSEDFVRIAEEHRQRERDAARQGGPVLISDTDAFATSVWYERYMGTRSEDVERLAERARPSLYLLTHHDDVPFEQDGTRDGEQIRAWMTERFAQRLDETGRRFVWIRGSREKRISQALAAIDEMLREGWQLAHPLG